MTRLIGQINPLEIITPMSYLIIAILLLAAVVAMTKVWYQRTKSQEANVDLLSSFRDLREQGELSPEEFQKVKEKLRQGSSAPKPADPPLPPPQSFND